MRGEIIALPADYDYFLLVLCLTIECFPVHEISMGKQSSNRRRCVRRARHSRRTEGEGERPFDSDQMNK